ncbi:xanthine dehydrogenase family protein molybdopterin-binding subunit [Caloranaerobacter ferrireducens]|uniref:xanthine dehydrogenase family protein molybdopterin-binding subunit n=1 Tax=Caloranaerobacter ferrireducens TaxID=1323370 RepID=UPI00084DDAA2|nr:molybdopterin cofactor-binding domain-containing protein [Caloranaerobacter ferrireducens]
MKKRGKGIACIFYGTGYGNGFPDVSRAIAELRKDGNIAIYVGATEVGQGAKTIMLQMAAEVLGIQVKDIILSCEDTSITPDSGTAAASRQTYNTGNAVKIAVEKLRKELIQIAAKRLGLNSTVGLETRDKKIYLKSYSERFVTFKELASSIKENIKKEGIFIAQTTKMDDETGQGAPYWPYTVAACSVEIEVDTETGKVEVLKAVFAQDVGKAVNPKLIEGQIDGGFSMGLGYALMEDLKLKNGEIKNNSFTNYLIPTSMDMPEIEKVIIEEPESTAPFGAKGIGEPVTIPVAPAILNAIYDAVGVRMTEIPVTPDRLLKALKEKNLGAISNE